MLRGSPRLVRRGVRRGERAATSGAMSIDDKSSSTRACNGSRRRLSFQQMCASSLSRSLRRSLISRCMLANPRRVSSTATGVASVGGIRGGIRGGGDGDGDGGGDGGASDDTTGRLGCAAAGGGGADRAGWTAACAGTSGRCAVISAGAAPLREVAYCRAAPAMRASS